VQHHKITREELSVREYMSSALRRCRAALCRVRRPVRPEKGSTVLVVTFIALLELAKET
jgi:segregation and condensation protein A